MNSFSRPAFRFALAGLCTLVAFLPARAADSIPDGWFAWPAVEPVAGSALDVSSLNSARGETLPRIAVKDGHFITPDGHRIRFWGTNVAGAEAYPATAEAAATIARRFAKGGVNIVRLHHLDNPWGVGKGGSIWPVGTRHEEFDPTQLDKLHRFIAALRHEGIYTNLNLKVSKQLSADDGFDPSVTTIANFQKRVDIFNRRMIDLQKDYARRILTTKNPYTGLAPAEDPAIAIVELNNENSLLGYWTRDLGRGLDKFPPSFREDLRTQWNAWLARHYADDTALAHAWAPPSFAAAPSLIPASARWRSKIEKGCTATVTEHDPASLEINVIAADGVDWHVQLSLGGLSLADGAVYTVEFLAKADQPRKLGLGVGIDQGGGGRDPWRSFGLLETVEVGADWQPVRLVFPAHSVAGAPAALSLNAGQSIGSISIKELRLHPGADGSGLHAGESPRANTVPLPLVPSTRQWADWIAFLADTERAFADEMRAYLKDELHVQAPIVCSQIDYGGLTGMNREHAMEVADAHAYWQHPDFAAGADWDDARWTIKNSPQLADFNDRTFGELGNLAMVRVAGKPFTVSEYDHPAPSEFACEMYPEVASFAARQDWDIVYTFCIGAYGDANPDGSIRDYFDQLHNPAKWAQSPFAALLLRRGLVPAAPNATELLLPSPLWAEQLHAEVLWRKLIPAGPFAFLNVRYSVNDRPGAGGASASIMRRGASGATVTPVRIVSAPQGRVYVIDSDQAVAAVGYLGGGKTDAGPLHVACGQFGREFASVTGVSLDGKSIRESGRVLLTIVARATNQGIEWNAAHNSLGKNWGHGSTIVERVPATISLAGLPKRVVYALAPDGSRAHAVDASVDGSLLVFAIDPSHQTLHYEIVAK